jgi:hypothetical protein
MTCESLHEQIDKNILYYAFFMIQKKAGNAEYLAQIEQTIPA